VVEAYLASARPLVQTPVQPKINNNNKKKRKRHLSPRYDIRDMDMRLNIQSDQRKPSLPVEFPYDTCSRKHPEFCLL
jgi:hypothetical protein